MESLNQVTVRAVRLAGIGAAFAFVWLTMSLLLGLGAGHANASENDDSAGLLGSLTHTAGSLVTTGADLVSDATTAATDLVADTGAAATTVLTPVVETVAEIAPGLPVAPVVDVVGSVVSTVDDVAAAGVVAPVVDSTVGTLTDVPVAGTLVTALHLDRAASSLGHSVDGTLHGATSSLAGVVNGVAAASPSGTGDLPVSPFPGFLFPAAPPVASDSHPLATGSGASLPVLTAARSVATVAAASTAALTSVFALSSLAGAATDHASAGGIPIPLLGTVMPPDFVFTGSGGAGPGAWMLVAFGLFIAYRAWMRRSGPSNDTAPAAPTLSTDVSPD